MGASELFERGGGGFYADIAGPDLRVLDGIASWCGGLHGSMQLGDALKSLGIDLNAVTDQLETEGVEQFTQAFDRLLEALAVKRHALT